MEQWNSDGGTVMVEQCRWNSDGGTVRWNSGTVLVEHCSRTVEQCLWNSVGYSGTVRWNNGTVLVE